jgi:hypothetical protein
VELKSATGTIEDKMIDIAEYDRFLAAEVHYHDRPLKSKFIKWEPKNDAPRSWRLRDKHNGQDIEVIYGGVIMKYNYFCHPRFGVVKALNDGGTVICKSPVCESLDKELFNM